MYLKTRRILTYKWDTERGKPNKTKSKVKLVGMLLTHHVIKRLHDERERTGPSVGRSPTHSKGPSRMIGARQRGSRKMSPQAASRSIVVDILDEHAVAKIFRITTRTLRRWIKLGIAPPNFREGGSRSGSQWRHDYTYTRPHGSLGALTPHEFAMLTERPKEKWLAQSEQARTKSILMDSGFGRRRALQTQIVHRGGK